MARSILILTALALIGAGGCAAGDGAGTDAAYVSEIGRWHAERIDRLRSATGWLTLVGLHPLVDGANAVGSDPDAGVRLIGKAPPHVGVLDLTGDGILFTADAGATVVLAGTDPPVRVSRVRMNTDLEDETTRLEVGSLQFHVIDRQGDLYLRVKDRESEMLASFTGIDRFPVDASWRVEARLEGEASTIRVPNVLGQLTDEPSPGVLVFERDGRRHRLTPTGNAADEMFVVFGDASNGRETYPGGRFLSIEAATDDGVVIIDFNKAHNPPCVFTPFATCPLPPPGNTLGIAVTAGEKSWGTGH